MGNYLFNMKKLSPFLFFLLFFQLLAYSKPVETFYGTIEVTEPLLLELIESAPMQRLKKVHQYGVSYYTSHREEYSRYDHSLGVFAILRLKGASLKEQVAGLLHDVSHTVFSHVGDFVFQHDASRDSYQDKIHEWFLEKYGIGKILKKHGYTVAEVHPDSGAFHALEQDLPDLCADRIDYNLQGAFHRGFLTKKEALTLLESMVFEEGRWESSRPDLMKKVVRFSLFMTEDCWGSADNYLKSTWLAEVIIKAIQLKKITWEDVYYGTDDRVWVTLKGIDDPYISERFQKILHPQNHFQLSDKGSADLEVRQKFRGINPLIRSGSELKRLTEWDTAIAGEYYLVKKRMEKGWSIKMLSPICASAQ
ncbi:MAG: hypothetical protein KR126chlam1_00690 [Chlamydiae bacterium]|nr:hypothetical protein [Chlamydiota bacterium]